jgi:hypothetical protein
VTNHRRTAYSLVTTARDPLTHMAAVHADSGNGRVTMLKGECLPKKEVVSGEQMLCHTIVADSLSSRHRAKVADTAPLDLGRLPQYTQETKYAEDHS